MKKPSKKTTLRTVTDDVSDIKELYEALIKKGFTTEQAFELTKTILKLVLKWNAKDISSRV